MNLRERVESDLAITVEGRWGLPVFLTSPDGEKQINKKGTTVPLKGQVLYDIMRLDLDTGEDKLVGCPVVTLRRTSLDRVPEPGENWLIEIPDEPREDADMVSYVLSPTRPPEGGRSIGFIRLYLQQVEQS